MLFNVLLCIILYYVIYFSRWLSIIIFTYNIFTIQKFINATVVYALHAIFSFFLNFDNLVFKLGRLNAQIMSLCFERSEIVAHCVLCGSSFGLHAQNDSILRAILKQRFWPVKQPKFSAKQFDLSFAFIVNYRE